MFNSPRLRDLFGGVAVADLTAADLAAAVTNGVAEMEELDWKKAPYQGPERSEEAAKDVAAFANHQGGVLVIGVAEERGTAKAEALTPFSVTPESVTLAIRQACADNIYPRIVDLDFVAIPADGAAGWFLVVAVAPSRDAPHAVAPARKHSLVYPVRDGQRTHHLREAEIAMRYRSRFTAAADVSDAARSELAQGMTRLSTKDAVWVSIACAPSSPGARPSGERARAREVGFMQSWAAPAGDRVPVNREDPRVGVRRTRFLNTPLSRDKQSAGYAELIHNGGGFAARQVGNETAVETPVAFDSSTTLLVAVDRVEWALFATLALLVEHAIDTGAGGDLEVAAALHTEEYRHFGVCIPNEERGYRAYRVEWDMQPCTATNTQSPPTSYATVPIAGGRDYRLIASAAYALGTDLLAAFAVDTPRLFQPDGWADVGQLGPYLTQRAVGHWLADHLNVDDDVSTTATSTD